MARFQMITQIFGCCPTISPSKKIFLSGSTSALEIKAIPKVRCHLI